MNEKNDNSIVFISGTNRGIGYDLAVMMSYRGYKVVAGYRNEESSKKLLEEAKRTENIYPIKVDIRNENDIENLKNFIETEFGKLDILINSAGINISPSIKLNKVSWKDIESSFLTNVGGAFMSSKILYPLIKNSVEKKIINISSILGSIELSNGGSIPYRISKSGLNMLMKNQAVEYRHDNITVVSIHPGWVRTDMGGDAAPLSSEESARKIMQIIERINLSNSGEYISVNGELIPF